MSGARVAFRADASAALGGGHMMRCLTLANVLGRRGAEVRFFVNEGAEAHVPALAAVPWQTVPPDAEAAAAAMAEAGGADVLVIDHYGIAEAEERHFARAVRRIAVIDDLADRRHDCALLIDQTFGREAGDYDGLVPDSAERLAGSRYAMLRPEFAAARPAALARREAAGEARRLLVSMGLTDVGGVTGRVVEALGGVGLAIDILIAPGAPSHAALAGRSAADPRLTLHVPGADVVRLMSEADLAIGAAGSTSWERCCLGLPTVMLVLADNQRAVAANLAAAGAAFLASGPAEAARAAAELAADAPRLAAMSRLSATVTDGFGAERVADRILAL